MRSPSRSENRFEPNLSFSIVANNQASFGKGMRYNSAMDRLLLTHLPVILAVARTKSFVRAGAELGLGASAVSHGVRSVEDRLGVTLFARTTRSVSLTEAGTAYVEGAERAIQELEGAAETVRAGQQQVSGLLRINVPHVALHLGLTPILLEASRRHPQLTIEVISDDALTDVVAEGFDAGIRLGEMIAQDMVAVRMTPPLRAIIAASPEYLARTGTPANFDELRMHNCIGYRLLGSGAVYAWDLDDQGKDIRLAVSGTVRVSDSSYAAQLAVAGLGIAYLFEQLIATELSDGRLVEILPQAAITEPGLFLYFPQRAARASKLRAFLDVIRDVT